MTPNSLTFSSLIKIKAEPPSLILEALAAVIYPVLLKAGLKAGILSFLNL